MNSTTTHDYPAAHSMDTTWFAVDSEGYVAHFFSSEEGPVPRGVETGLEFHHVLPEFFREPLSLQLQHEITALHSEPERDVRAVLNLEADEEDDDACVYNVLLLCALEGLPAELIKRCIKVQVGSPIYFTRKIRSRDLEKLIQQKQCLGFRLLSGSDEMFQPTCLGLFSFEFPFEEDPCRITYDRKGTPENPMHIDQAPPAIQKIAARNGFPSLRFNDRESIAMLRDCSAPLLFREKFRAYLDVEDGEEIIKPFPGNEKLYVREFDVIERVYGSDYKLTPPTELPTPRKKWFFF